MVPKAKREKRRSTLDKVITREYTIHLHKHLHGVTNKKKAPRAMKIIKKIARRQMSTRDVRIDSRVNKFVWSRGIKNPPFRIRVRFARRRNESDDSPKRLYTLVSFVPTASFNGLLGVNVDEGSD